MPNTKQDLMILPRLTHIALRVANIERTAAFYEKYAAFKMVSLREESDTRVAWLGNPDVKNNFVIVLLEFPFEKTASPRFHHIGLGVSTRELVDQVAVRARQEGILEMEPDDHGPIVGYYCMIRDPDDNMVEFSCGQQIEEVLNEYNPS